MYIFPNFNFYSTVENYELNNDGKNVGPYCVMLFLESSDNMARPLGSKFVKTVVYESSQKKVKEMMFLYMALSGLLSHLASLSGSWH